MLNLAVHTVTTGLYSVKLSAPPRITLHYIFSTPMATACSNKSSHLALQERNVASTTVETLTCDKLPVSYRFPRHNLSRLNATNGRLLLSTRSILLHQRPPSSRHSTTQVTTFNPLKPELNPICYLLALLGAHHFLHVTRIRVKLLTFRRLMSYIYMEHPFLMFLDHTQRRSTVGRTPLDE